MSKRSKYVKGSMNRKDSGSRYHVLSNFSEGFEENFPPLAGAKAQKLLSFQDQLFIDTAKVNTCLSKMVNDLPLDLRSRNFASAVVKNFEEHVKDASTDLARRVSLEERVDCLFGLSPIQIAEGLKLTLRPLNRTVGPSVIGQRSVVLDEVKEKQRSDVRNEAKEKTNSGLSMVKSQGEGKVGLDRGVESFGLKEKQEMKDSMLAVAEIVEVKGVSTPFGKKEGLSDRFEEVGYELETSVQELPPQGSGVAGEMSIPENVTSVFPDKAVGKIEEAEAIDVDEGSPEISGLGTKAEDRGIEDPFSPGVDVQENISIVDLISTDNCCMDVESHENPISANKEIHADHREGELSHARQ
ncbi:hypothetical protein U1Q18_047982, partial [Sarracenia purpurea var. burkii]